jgi:hypothetical protein
MCHLSTEAGNQAKKKISIHLCEAQVNVIVGEPVTGVERGTFAKKNL